MKTKFILFLLLFSTAMIAQEVKRVAILETVDKENKISYRKLFEDIKTCMEDDGFFDLSGLTEMMEEMNSSGSSMPSLITLV